MPSTPVKVAVTGAAGQIAYSLLFRVASGAMLGPDQPVSLQLLEIPEALSALRGVGMERRDLLEANGGIFAVQGRALAAAARRDVRVLVVGNPANTNCLVAAHNAGLGATPLAPEQFAAMTRLDHNRAVARLAARAGAGVNEVRRVAIWGNHSATQYPDLYHAEVAGRPALEAVGGLDWVEKEFIPAVQQRGAAVIEARGASSAASAASAAIDTVRDWALGTQEGDWTSMAVWSKGAYGAPKEVYSSFPVTAGGWSYELVEGLEVSDFSRVRMEHSNAELVEEREAVAALGLLA